MKLKCIMVCLLGFISIYTTWITPVHAFMDNYISGDKGDMAILSGLKISTIEYESNDTNAGDIDRKIFSLGLSRSVSSKMTVFGSFNDTFDGELGGNHADLDCGYSLTAGGSYNFWNHEKYSLQAYGKLNYIFDEKFKYSRMDMDLSLNGHEWIVGATGIYRFNPRLYAYSALQIVPLSNLRMDVSNPTMHETWDIERDHKLGINFGLIYDGTTWFVKGELELISEQALGISWGINI